MDIDAPVLGALVFDLADPEPTDLAGGAHVGAATRLQIGAHNIDDADMAGARWRLRVAAPSLRNGQRTIRGQPCRLE